MADTSFRFRPTYARRIPDPNFKNTHNAEKHIFLMQVGELPSGIGLDPNARNPNIRKRVYRQVEESLLNKDESEPNTFHLKNKGIVMIAATVQQVGDNEYDVTMQTGVHGIVDGGHTYELIQTNKTDGALPENQYVFVEVRVGIPDQWIRDIAGGLNTSVQVQPMSLDHLAGAFEWIKKELKPEPYYEVIAWSENDPGEYDARDIISLLYILNAELFPNDKDDHPVAGYEKKSLVLKEFENKGTSFERMKPILKDIVRLHDIIRLEARYLYNKETGGKGGRLVFVDHRKRGKFVFPFTGAEDDYRLMNGALYPMLAAFRWYVDLDPVTLKMCWRDSFKDVVQAWRVLGAELMRATLHTSNELGRNPNAIGKSRNHWSNLHARVAKHDLMARQAAST